MDLEPRVGLQRAVREHSAFYDAGSINFKQRRKTAKAQFIRVTPTVAPRVLNKEINRTWRREELGNAKPPGLILRITGERSGELPDVVVETLEGGIVHAAGLAGAWTFTNGLDSGVVNTVGNAHMRMQHRWNGPLVGIADWNATQGREQLLATHRTTIDGDGHAVATGLAEGELKPSTMGGVLQRRLAQKSSKREYKETRGANGTVCLEPNHTHFIMVGGPPPVQKQASHGDMIASVAQACVANERAAGAGPAAGPLSVVDGLECAMAREHGCARVLLVVGGGEEVLDELVAMLRADKTSTAIMLNDDTPEEDGDLPKLRDSDGKPSRLSDAVTRFYREKKVPSSWRHRQADFDQLSTFGFKSSAWEINEESGGAQRGGRIMICTAEEISPGETPALGECILKAVLEQVVRPPASHKMALLSRGHMAAARAHVPVCPPCARLPPPPSPRMPAHSRFHLSRRRRTAGQPRRPTS